LGALAFGIVGACIGAPKAMSDEDRAKLKSFVVSSLPAGVTAVDVNFDNKVHLIGYRVTPPLAEPGQEVSVTFYWRCDEPLDEGWWLFSHLVDSRSRERQHMDAVGPLRERRGDRSIFPPQFWEKSKVYQDTQTFTMPDWGDRMGSEVTLTTGFWSTRTNQRMGIKSGPQDENATIVAKIKTGRTPKADNGTPKSFVPELRVPKLADSDKIVIDGKLDDKAWRSAAWTGDFVDVATGVRASGFPAGSAKLLWDDTRLYVAFEVKDSNVVGPFTDAKLQPGDFTATGQPKLWTKDTVEIMIDPEGDGDNIDYYELQINPQNRVFHSQFDSYNSPKVEPNGPFGHEDWDPKLQSAVNVRGTINKTGDTDDGYDVEIAIPWAALSKVKVKFPQNPGPLRMNFYAMENNGGAAWSPILGQGNFHKATRFGKVFLTKAADHNAGLRDSLGVGTLATATAGTAATLPATAAVPTATAAATAVSTAGAVKFRPVTKP
jgi:Carbohydrate family 9 binding domain-like